MTEKIFAGKVYRIFHYPSGLITRSLMRIGIFAWIFLIILIFGSSFDAFARAVKQPIDFNHKLHITDIGLTCQECHVLVRTYYRAGIPNIEVCSMCHDEGGDGQKGGNPKAQVVLDYIKKGKAIPWQRVYVLPDHVYFSHQRHAGIAGIQCSVCHGKVEQNILPITKEAVKPTMDRCMNCHKKSGVTNDCLACHK